MYRSQSQSRQMNRHTLFSRILVALGLCLIVMLAPAQAQNGRRIALVIGNDAYQNVGKLQKAGNDATAMARELKAAGFDVVLQRDLNYRAMVRAVETLVRRITGGDQVVVFFAGHGVQLKSGSYLLPIDIETGSESEVEKTAYGLNDLMEKLGDARAGFTLVMVDACRDNPLKSNGRGVGGTRGLSAIEPARGQMVVYSASKGQQALDRLSSADANPNGVFTREFIARMRRPGVRIEDLVREVQDAVETLAGTVSHEQRPAIYNEARGNFYFFGPTTVQVAPAVMGAAGIEQELWDSIKDDREAIGFDEFLKQYPKGRYAGQARIKLAKLKAEARRPAVNSAGSPALNSAINPAVGPALNPALNPAVNPAAIPAVISPLRQAVQSAAAPVARPVSSHAAAGSTFHDCADCPEMVVIPAGNGMAGFALGQGEVTQGQWQAVMGDNPSHFSECGTDCPVEQVSWDDVQQFIGKLNASTGKVYRLPSEQEWEYACLAGQSTEYCGGNEPDALAWHEANSGHKTRQGKGRRANAFGLYDMSGNVSEWTDGCWEGDCARRVARGGSWGDGPQFARVASSEGYPALTRIMDNGFRLARSAQ